MEDLLVSTRKVGQTGMGAIVATAQSQALDLAREPDLTRNPRGEYSTVAREPGGQGARGSRGFKGTKGNNIGIQGDQGHQGDKRKQWNPRGPKGSRGSRGSRGPRGPKGIMEIQIPKGPKGTKGKPEGNPKDVRPNAPTRLQTRQSHNGRKGWLHGKEKLADLPAGRTLKAEPVIPWASSRQSSLKDPLLSICRGLVDSWWSASNRRAHRFVAGCSKLQVVKKCPMRTWPACGVLLCRERITQYRRASTGGWLWSTDYDLPDAFSALLSFLLLPIFPALLRDVRNVTTREPHRKEGGGRCHLRIVIIKIKHTPLVWHMGT
ncbi:hypothetical protein M430DRAFT_58564 [Amorphotheca resinae ATCC 22711]|uniref:Uncharacterized protein n=1 Tax=Amorphotheca resinae ATCC 22711 TaxID=857342 RepID=A0A2T3B1D8_AMORE|nr:hypothetical protein M430DRAFT_58564 [Amorphotheca resinae ATCC 22711]PSS18384.1 hypothetical protein M430DRAFT_58564 [Amorphotheca resinae ATCC 22711]